MASASKKTTSSCCFRPDSAALVPRQAAPAAKTSSSAVVSASGIQDWSSVAGSEDRCDAQHPKNIAMAALIPKPSANASTAGIPIMFRPQTRHPLDPLSAAEISVAVATIRAAGATPEVRDSMHFVEVVLLEPNKHVVALADAYFFPPFQSSLLPRTKGGPIIPTKLPPRRARLIVYNKKSNETSTWIVELSEVHASTRSGSISKKKKHCLVCFARIIHFHWRLKQLIKKQQLRRSLKLQRMNKC